MAVAVSKARAWWSSPQKAGRTVSAAAMARCHMGGTKRKTEEAPRWIRGASYRRRRRRTVCSRYRIREKTIGCGEVRTVVTSRGVAVAL